MIRHQILQLRIMLHRNQTHCQCKYGGIVRYSSSLWPNKEHDNLLSCPFRSPASNTLPAPKFNTLIKMSPAPQIKEKNIVVLQSKSVLWQWAHCNGKNDIAPNAELMISLRKHHANYRTPQRLLKTNHIDKYNHEITEKRIIINFPCWYVPLINSRRLIFEGLIT